MAGELLVFGRGLVRASLCIQAGAGKSKALDWAAMDEVFCDDFIDIFEVDEAVPDGLGIDHHGRAVLALIEAAGLVGADEMLEASVFDGVLEGGFELLAALRETAWTRCGLVALVGADEEVMFEFRQWGEFLLCFFCSGGCAGRAAF